MPGSIPGLSFFFVLSMPGLEVSKYRALLRRLARRTSFSSVSPFRNYRVLQIRKKKKSLTAKDMSSITITIPDDVMKTFTDFKLRHKHKYVLLEIDQDR